MQKNVISIAFGLDNNFAQQLAVTIVSILKSSSIKDHFHFYVLDGGLTEENKEKITRLKKIKKFDIDFIKMENENFEDLPTIEYRFSQAVYYRFNLPSLLNLDKILYLDCDIFVKKSLREFYNIDISNKYAAVIQDYGMKKGVLKDRLEKLNLRNYFNSGVMLLNLKKIREDNIREKCFNFVEEYPDKIKFPDQCVLNHAFEENVLFVDEKYNFQYPQGDKEISECYKKNKNKYVLLHFICELKPWSGKCHPFEFEYNWLLSRTAFGKPRIFLICNFLNNYLKIKKIQLTFKALSYNYI